MMLAEHTPGDIVVIRWSDATSDMHGTEQIVLFCTPMGGGRGKRQKLENAHSAIVKLVDPETLLPYPCGSYELGRNLNMFVHPNVEVIDIVQRSKHAHVDRDTELAIGKLGDDSDPFLRRMSARPDTDVVGG